MAETLTLGPGAKDAELQAAVKEVFAEMERIDVRIAQNQADIDRLQAETRAMLNELKITLRMSTDVARIS